MFSQDIWDDPSRAQYGYTGGLVYTEEHPNGFEVKVSSMRHSRSDAPQDRFYLLVLYFKHRSLLHYIITNTVQTLFITDILKQGAQKIPKDCFFELCVKKIGIATLCQEMYDFGIVAGRELQREEIKKALGI